MTHVEEEKLLQFTLGQLDATAVALVEAHLAECADCKRRQERLSSIAFSKTAVGSSKDGAPTRAEGSGLGAPGLALSRGDTLGRYALLEKLGAGGMGEVFAAYDPQLDRKVALKLLRGGALSAEEGKARLLREAQAMARLQHPNVVSVHDVGTFGDRVFVAMEFVEGETLAEWLRAPRPWEEVVGVFRQAGEGLAAAHAAGLVHRDFKPENVLIGLDLRPRVVDFGLARQSTATPTSQEREAALGAELNSDSTLLKALTRDGAVMGTPGYMAPEQLAGLPTDARCDQFAFCIALWEGLFGRRPFGGATLKQHAQEIAAGRLSPPPADTKVPGWLQDALRRGLKANPDDRWPDMRELLKALRPRKARNPRATVFVSGLVFFSLLGIGYGAWSRQRLLVCGGQERRLAGVWDSGMRAKLRAGFIGSGLSYAEASWKSVERTLDLWGAEWTATAREVCEAAKVRKTDSAELTELKESCLDDRLERLKALVLLLETPDRDVVANAATAARELDPASVCTSGSPRGRRLAGDEKEKAAELALRSRLAEARALFAAGKYGPAAEKLKQGLSPGAPSAAQADAFLWLSRIESKRSEPRLARAASVQAAEHALKSGEPGVVARALSRLYANEGFDEGDANAETWGRLAAAAAARVPGDWEVQVELLQNDGFVSIRRKKHKAALADFEGVLVLQREHLGAAHPEVASTLNNLGVVLTHLQQPAEAVARYEESLALHMELEGPEHPNVALATHNLAAALRSMGRTREAREAYQRAVEIRRSALGLQHADTLRSLTYLVRLEIGLSELESARTGLDALKDARLSLSGAESTEMLDVLELEAELYLEGGFWKEAAPAAAAHLALARQRGPAGEKHVSRALLEQASAAVGLGAWADARRAIAEVQRRQAAGDAAVNADALAEAQGRLELAQGHAAEGIPSLERAVAEREKGAPLSLVKSLVLLSHAQLAAGELEDALAAAQRAEATAAEAQAERLLLDARVARAQAQWLARPDERATAAEALQQVLEALPDARRASVQDWLRAHPAGAPDAGP